MDARRFILRLVAGGYVFYIGIQLLQGYLSGVSEMNGTVSIIAGVLFLIFGAWSVLSALIPVVKNGGFISSSTGSADDEAVEDTDTEEVDVDETDAVEADVVEETEAEVEVEETEAEESDDAVTADEE